MKLNKFCAALAVVAVVLCASSEVGLCRDGQIIRMKPGGVHNCKGHQNSAQIESLARFAVEEHNKNENALLEFARVLKAKEQVVAGTMYHLTLEAVDAGKKKIYEAKVWVKPWMNFKQLQEFKYAQDVPTSMTSDLGVKRGH
ncbi:hypothetical protein NL676_017077 [Syzygium grande]|nr:hypothetical protein NL676_017077 [Syzygium grande]